jgi:hypothetical protein
MLTKKGTTKKSVYVFLDQPAISVLLTVKIVVVLMPAGLYHLISSFYDEVFFICQCSTRTH